MATSTTTLAEDSVELRYWHQHRAGTGEQHEAFPGRSRVLSDPERDNAVIQQLLPADGGPAAWRLLIAAFVFEALLWGL